MFSGKRNSRFLGAAAAFEPLEEEEIDAVQAITTLEDATFLIDKAENTQNSSIIIPLLKKNVWRGISNDSTDTEDHLPSQIEVRTSAKREKVASDFEEEKEEDCTPMNNKFGLIIPKGKRRKMKRTEPVEVDKSFDITTSSKESLTEDERAIAALMAEANGEVQHSIDVGAIPLMAINKVPGIDNLPDETAKYRHDVSLRPDESTLEDYERVPIEAFGKAMLLGMGWKENDTRFPKAHLPEARPHLAGLGANVSKEMPIPTRNGMNPAKTDSSSGLGKEEKLSRKLRVKDDYSSSSKKIIKIEIGNIVRIVKGDNKGRGGEVIDIKESKDGRYLKISASKNETIKEWEDYVILESKYELKSKSWLKPHLRVKITDDRLQNKSLFLKKCVIQDVVSSGLCIAITDDGLTVELKQSQVQTCIPGVNERVLVIQGKHDGESGVIYEKDKRKEKAVVKLDSDLSFHIFHFDDICELTD